MRWLEPQRTTRQIVLAVRLKKAAVEELQRLLGPGAVVADIVQSSAEADIVVCPPCSPQTIAALRQQFPRAQVVVAEIQDAELGVDVGGPITRSLDAGAGAYLIASSIDDLAATLGGNRDHHQISRSAPAGLARNSPGVDDEILQALAEVARRDAVRIDDP